MREYSPSVPDRSIDLVEYSLVPLTRKAGSNSCRVAAMTGTCPAVRSQLRICAGLSALVGFGPCGAIGQVLRGTELLTSTIQQHAVALMAAQVPASYAGGRDPLTALRTIALRSVAEPSRMECVWYRWMGKWEGPLNPQQYLNAMVTRATALAQVARTRRPLSTGGCCTASRGAIQRRSPTHTALGASRAFT